MSSQIWQLTASEMARAIRTRSFSSRDAVMSSLGRLEEVNPRINAVVDVLSDAALTAADGADRAVKDGQPLGPLHGVPVTVKINVDYAGRPTTNGVVAFKDLIAKEDSTPVANLRKAGAVIIGRTNVPAFSTRYFTDNDLYGRTLNPWDATRTPGGSSGGAAAAVAVGITPIGHGNDRAGSIRYPAYACGVAGLRPSFGRVADYSPGSTEERGISSQLTFVQGAIARSIPDLRLALTALAARDARDPWWAPVCAETEPGKSGIPVAMFSTFRGARVDASVTEAVHQAARWLEDAGYRVEEAVPPDFAEAADLFWSLLMTEEKAVSAQEKAQSTKAIEMFGDEAVRRARAATQAYATELGFEGYVKGLARRSTILRKWLLFLERYPLLLMPISWQRPYPIDHDQQGNEAVRQMLDAHHPMLAVSILGLPGLAIPTGLVDGVPMGVQLVASRFREDICLAAGEVIEARCSMKMPL